MKLSRVFAGLVLLAVVAPVASAQTVTVSGTGGTIRIARPAGYIGIVYSGDQRVEASHERKSDQVVERRFLVSYADYPVIVSVEPESPAARAGLQAGDTVLSYNGRDVVREPFPLFDMLKPGERITMRVRRNGNVRSVAVTVAPRPAAFGEGGEGFLFHFTPEAEQARRELERSLELMRRETERNRELTPKQREEIARAGAAARAKAPAPLVTPVTPIAPMAAWMGVVAGAEMTAMNDDLADLVGLRRGVFVVKVNPGTPAERSGLRGGDVIIAVGDSTVNDVTQLRRAITAEQRRIRTARAAREIQVDIVRKHRKQKVVLRY